jgi:hypothetical protein
VNKRLVLSLMTLLLTACLVLSSAAILLALYIGLKG